MINLYDALDLCLQALEQGQDIDSILAQYPDLKAELKPVLEAALRARGLGDVTIPRDVQSRGRMRVLQKAADLRASQRVRSNRMIPFFPRLAVALGLAAVFFLSSTGLVSASSGALPGDQLYPVKRTWEDVRLFFAFSPQGRDVLQSEYEQERLDEIDGLLARDRAATVTFSGLVTKQSATNWVVSGIPVLITSSTQLSTNSFVDGSPVSIMGITHAGGLVEAQEIQLLQSGVSLPPLEPSDKTDTENEGGKAISTPFVPKIVPQTPGPHKEANGQSPQIFEFHGIVNNIQKENWTINGQNVSVIGAQIQGNIQTGALVKFQGYYTQDGRFIVTSIEEQSNGGNPGDNGGNKQGGNNNGSDNGSKDSGGGTPSSNGGGGNPGNGEGSGH